MNTDYCLNEGLSRLKQFDPSLEIMHKWCRKLIYKEKLPNLRFYNSTKQHKGYKVPVNNIIGTDHVDYANKNWLQMLGGLKRFHSYTKDNYLDYMEGNTNNYNALSFSKYGDDFIINEGNHRTCLAVLSGLEYIETNVTECFFDEHLYTSFNKLEELNLLSKFFDFHDIRTNNPTKRVWALNLNSINIYIRNQDSLDYFLELYQSITINWKSFYFIPIKRKFIQLDERSYISIYTKEDVDKLIDDIILHKIALASNL